MTIHQDAPISFGFAPPEMYSAPTVIYSGRGLTAEEADRVLALFLASSRQQPTRHRRVTKKRRSNTRKPKKR